MKKTLLITAAALAMTGCMSLKTEMVNAKGDFKNCEATGGGLGLGAVVGVALAAASRGSCVSEQKEDGFLEADAAGTLNIQFLSQTDAKLIVSKSSVTNILAGDRILALDGKEITTQEEFHSAAFGPLENPVKLKIARADSELLQTVARSRFEKPKNASK